jgi:hypothetical protein
VNIDVGDREEVCGFRWPAGHGGQHQCGHRIAHAIGQHWCPDDGAHVDALDTANRFMLGVRGGLISPAVPLVWPINPAQAVLMAAWLVALAEGLDPDAGELLVRTLDGVRSAR